MKLFGDTFVSYNNMKLIYIYTFILLFPFISQAQWVNKWEKVNIPDRYSRQAYLDIYFLPADRNLGWACGFRSQVSFTKDGGETWKTVNVDPNNPVQLESIHFVNANIGYTSGPPSDQDRFGAIYRTTDGGNTWRDVTPDSKLSISLWGCYFYDENNGFALGGNCDFQFFFKTTDGGNTWKTNRYESKNFTKLSDVYVDGATGIGQAISSGVVWKTTDYGDNWFEEFTTGPSDWHEELAFMGDSFIIPVDESCFGSQTIGNGGMLFTTDRGKTFNRKTLSLGSAMYGSFMINETTGWVCGLKGSAYFTCDAGVNWEKLDCGLEGDLDDIFFVDDTTGWVVGAEIFRTKSVSESNKVVVADTIRICKGETVDIKVDSTRKYANYNWSQCGFGESSFSVGEGNYKVYAYNDPCDTAFIYEYVVEYFRTDIPKIITSTNEVLCEGDYIFLTETSANEIRYWNTGDTSRTIKVSVSGTYIVKTNSPDGCSQSDTLIVTFNPLPKPNIIPISANNFCIGDSILLESEFAHDSYLWLNPTGLPISREKSINAKESGEYKLIAFNESGCSDTSAAFTVIIRLDSNRLSIDYSYTEPFVFDTLMLSKTICQKMKITNTSQQEYLLSSVILRDKYYFAFPPSNLPVLINPQETIELDICFSGDSVGYFSDRLELDDVCKPHFMKVEGEIAPFDLSVITKCDVPWKFTSIELDRNHVFESSSPFPNPSFGYIALSYIEFLPNETDKVNLDIYDSFGNIVGKLDRRVSSLEYYKNGQLEIGEFVFEEKLKTGVYFIVTNGVENSKVIPIVISQ